MKKERVTIRDVARRAGVSHQTVSRVINNSNRVTDATRKRVECAIRQLDYRPNAIARSMARGRSGVIACLAPNLTDYTFASLIDGAEREARNLGYTLLSSSVPDVATFADLCDELVASRQVEGLIVVNPFADERYNRLPSGTPIVFAGARPRAGSVHSVALDDVAVGEQATNHLLALGHRRIAMITGPLAEDCAQDRSEGYGRALAAAAIELERDLIVSGDWRAASGYSALQRLIAAGRLPTALFVQNDRMAVGAIRAAIEAGLDVPGDLSLIGIDDHPLIAYITPPLTTLRQDFQEIGRQAARLMQRAIIAPGDTPRQLRLPATLVVRSSTVPPRDSSGRSAPSAGASIA